MAALGVSSRGLLSFQLPDLNVLIVAVRDDGTRTALRPSYDTLLLDADAHRFELAMRLALPMGRGRTLLREVRAELDDG